MPRHKTTVNVKAIEHRGKSWKLDPIPNQFRFAVRLAAACHRRGIPYEAGLSINEGVAKYSLMVEAEQIPEAKALPKPKPEKKMPNWYPKPYEAEYQLEAISQPDGKKIPAFVIAHSSGLMLTKPSKTGEWESDHDDAQKQTDGWAVTHQDSGLLLFRVGTLSGSKNRLLAAAAIAGQLGLDFTKPKEALDPRKVRHLHSLVMAEHGDQNEREQARTFLNTAINDSESEAIVYEADQE